STSIGSAAGRSTTRWACIRLVSMRCGSPMVKTGRLAAVLACLYHGVERLRAILVWIAGNQDDLLCLAQPPQGSIWDMRRYTQTCKGLDMYGKLRPQCVPLRSGEQA